MAQNNRSGQGKAKDPGSDRRMKENRDEGREAGGQGRVKNPEKDGRLKENRN